jgi:hypothetical protein
MRSEQQKYDHQYQKEQLKELGFGNRDPRVGRRQDCYLTQASP